MGAAPAPLVYEYRLGSPARVLRLSGLRYAECEGDARGGAAWPAGTLLCDYLQNALGEEGLRGRRVLELGCGLGMCGLVAAALAGPTGCVLLTDGAWRGPGASRGRRSALSASQTQAMPAVFPLRRRT